MKTFHLLAVLLCLGGGLAAQPVIVPTQTDQITLDNPPLNSADPSDEIQYHVTIPNTGTAPAGNLQLNVVPDPLTTFLPGTFRTSPLAIADGPYAVTGNVGISVSAGNGLKINDYDDDFAGASVTAGTFTTAQGGSITVAADGSFIYTPPPGFTGSDSYIYTLNDGNPVGLPIPVNDMATVTFTVSNRIWFIDNSAAAGDGRLGTPFNSLSAFNAGSAAAGDVVYLEHTGTDYSGVITLQSNERLIGEGHTGGANLANVLPFGLAPFSLTLPNINGSRPVITNGSGNGIALAVNNSVRGVDVGNTTGTDITGSNFGTLTLSEVSLSGTGKALDLTTGTLAASFTSVVTTSSTSAGISLTSVAGTASLGSTSVSNSAGQGIAVNSSAANISFGNTSVSATGGSGVFLNANAGNNSFASLDIMPNTNQRALHATENTGMISSTGGVISSSGAVAVEITKASGDTPLAISLTSVSASGTTDGILLSRTSGAFAVNGTGTTDGSGGTIQNISGRGAGFTNSTGITLMNMTLTNANTTDGGTCGPTDNSGCNAAVYLNNVTNAVLNNVDISGTAQQGINVRETSGFQLLNSTLTNNGAGGQSEEAGLYGINLSGTAHIDNTSISFPSGRCAVIYNTGKTLAMTINGSQFNDTQSSAIGNDGFEMTSFSGAVTDLDITNSSFLRNRITAVQFLTEGTGIGTVDITGCTIDPQAGSGAGVEVVSNGTSQLKFNISNNPVVKARLINVINCFAQSSSLMEGQVSGNTVTSSSGSGSGVRAVASGNANTRIKILNNTISGINNDFGITAAANGGTGRMDATITGNNVTVQNTAGYNIQTIAGASGSTFTNKLCANVANNTVNGTPIGNFQARSVTPSHEFLLQGPGPTAQANWNANGNSVSPPAIVSQSGTGVFTFGATCLLPSYP